LGHEPIDIIDTECRTNTFGDFTQVNIFSLQKSLFAL